MRIDIHTHYTPPSLAGDALLLAEREPYWGLLLSPRPGEEAPAAEDAAARAIADMDCAGIDRAVVMGSYWRDHDACKANNDELLALARRWPNRFLPFACIQPSAGGRALDELKRCLDAGMVGVGELCAYAQGYKYDDPDFLRLAEACVDFGVPLSLHTGEPVGHLYPGKSTTPLAAFYALACSYPELKLVLAHWGGGLLFYEIMPEVRLALRNVYYDTAASPLLYPSEAIFRVALQCVSPDKILYGSDYPLPICRRKQCGPDFRPFLAEIADLELEPAVCDGILGDNAARLLGLSAPAAAAQAVAATPRERRTSANPPPRVAQALAITLQTPVRAAASAWPGTRAVFEKYGIPWEDNPVPFWEPIGLSAAARGLGLTERKRLLDELNDAAS